MEEQPAESQGSSHYKTWAAAASRTSALRRIKNSVKLIKHLQGSVAASVKD